LEEKVKETPFSRFFFGGEPIKLNVKCNLGVDIMIYNDKSISKHHGSIRTDPMAVEKLVLLQDMCKRDINIYFVLPPPQDDVNDKPQLYYTDNSSKYGTKINNQKVTETTELNESDVLSLGSFGLNLRCETRYIYG
jgi:hypothetical protein